VLLRVAQQIVGGQEVVNDRGGSSLSRQIRAQDGAAAGGGALLLFLCTILLIGMAAGAVYFFYCPCERTPGGWLLGEVISEPVGDWSFANEVPLCQIQVSRGLLPHSINLNCMAADGELYLSCASCEGKTWSTAALADPEARLRLEDKVYPVRLTRVEDAQTLDRRGGPVPRRPAAVSMHRGRKAGGRFVWYRVSRDVS
jgi:hypothetical protein